MQCRVGHRRGICKAVSLQSALADHLCWLALPVMTIGLEQGIWGRLLPGDWWYMAYGRNPRRQPVPMMSIVLQICRRTRVANAVLQIDRHFKSRSTARQHIHRKLTSQTHAVGISTM